MATKDKKLQEIIDNIKRQEAKRNPAVAAKISKQTPTPYGGVWNKLLTLSHNKALRKDEILAQWIRDKKTGNREKFVWLGVVEKSEYDVIGLGYKIYYRPFVSQHEQENKRINQLYTKQLI